MTNFLDADTVASKTSIIITDSGPYTDAATITSKSSIITADFGPYTDLATVANITEIPEAESQYVHPTGQWGPFDDDSGAIP